MKYIYTKLMIMLMSMPVLSGMDVNDIEARLKSNDNADFIEAVNYIDRLIDSRNKDQEKIEVARVLYQFIDDEHEEFFDEDILYSRGRIWVLSRMARLTSYEDSLPESSRNQYLPDGGRIDPLGNLTFDVTAQNEFLAWYEEKFLNSKSDQKPRFPPERHLDDHLQREAPNRLDQDGAAPKEAYEKNRLNQDSATPKEAYEKKQINLLLIVAGSILVGIIALLFKVWMGKPAR